MKKLISLALAGGMVLSLAACGFLCFHCCLYGNREHLHCGEHRREHCLRGQAAEDRFLYV